MKKLTMLTSVLALAACGGGGGGGGATSVGVPSAAVTVPDGFGRVVTTAAANSNANVTSMRSEVIVSSATNTPLSRSASTTVGGVTFTSYELDDIKLYAADSSNTANGYLNIGMDDEGRIEKITMNVGGVGAPVARVGETNQFNAPIFEYVPDGDDQAVFRVVDTGQDMAALNALATQNNLSGGHWNRVDEVMNVVTLGADIDGAGTKLQYADFGHFNPVYKEKLVGLTGKSGDTWSAGETKTHTDEQVNDELAAEDYQLFAGGYAISGTTLKDSLDPVKGASYKGTAIGRVYTHIGGDTTPGADLLAQYGITSGDGHDIAKAFTTKEATMTIDADGKQTLFMPFNTNSDTTDKFYDVTLVKNANGTMDTPVFDGTPTDSQYALHGAEEHVVQSTFNPGYYGVNTASEAAGTARMYSEQDLGGGFEREYELQAAWGMKKN